MRRKSSVRMRSLVLAVAVVAVVAGLQLAVLVTAVAEAAVAASKLRRMMQGIGDLWLCSANRIPVCHLRLG